jgi:integrase
MKVIEMARTKLQMPNFNMAPRADGYYEIRYMVGGKPAKKSTGTKNAVEAETFRANFARAFNGPKLSTRPTLSEVCDAFVEYRTPLVASAISLPYLYTPLKRHLGLIYADSLTQTDINRYSPLRGAEKTLRCGGRVVSDIPPSEATMRKELTMLRAALNWAYSEKLIPAAPAFRVELSTGTPRQDWLTKDEVSRLMKKCKPHLALFVLLAVSTAKRREAILSLEWENVQLHMQGYEAINFGDDVKNKRRGSATIAGHAKLLEALKAAKSIAASDYVIEWKGERLYDIKTTLQTACREAGVKHVTAHTFKHTSITWMVQAGMSYERIAKATNTTKEIIERSMATTIRSSFPRSPALFRSRCVLEQFPHRSLLRLILYFNSAIWAENRKDVPKDALKNLDFTRR